MGSLIEEFKVLECLKGSKIGLWGLQAENLIEWSSKGYFLSFLYSIFAFHELFRSDGCSAEWCLLYWSP